MHSNHRANARSGDVFPRSGFEAKSAPRDLSRIRGSDLAGILQLVMDRKLQAISIQLDRNWGHCRPVRQSLPLVRLSFSNVLCNFILPSKLYGCRSDAFSKLSYLVCLLAWM